MNLLSILGALPAASSIKGKLNSTDYKKLVRMGIVVAGSYVCVAVLEKLSVDLMGWGIPQELVTPLTGVLAIALEWARRKYSSAFQS